MTGCGRLSVSQGGEVEEACWSKTGEEVEAWTRDAVEEARATRMGVEVGAFGKKRGEEGEAFERKMGGVVETSERMGEEVEAYGRRWGELEAEALGRSLVVEGEARARKMVEGVVVG